MKKGILLKKNPFFLILPKKTKKQQNKTKRNKKYFYKRLLSEWSDSNLEKMIILKFYNAGEGDNFLIVHTGIPIFISFFIDK